MGKKAERGWLPCPRCDSARVDTTGAGATLGTGIMVICIGGLLMLFFPPAGLVIAGIGALFIPLALLKGIGQAAVGRTYTCKDCQKVYGVKGRRYV